MGRLFLNLGEVTEFSLGLWPDSTYVPCMPALILKKKKERSLKNYSPLKIVSIKIQKTMQVPTNRDKCPQMPDYFVPG